MLDLTPTASEQLNRVRELQHRRMNPPNGRISTELEILPPRAYLQRLRREADEREVQSKLAEARSKQRELEHQLNESREKLKKLEGRNNYLRRGADDIALTPPFKPLMPKFRWILQVVCDFYGVQIADILSIRRSAYIVLPRQIICFLARRMTILSLPAIGLQLGDRDHTTIMHAVDKIEHLMRNDRELTDEISYLRACLTNAL